MKLSNFVTTNLSEANQAVLRLASFAPSIELLDSHNYMCEAMQLAVDGLTHLTPTNNLKSEFWRARFEECYEDMVSDYDEVYDLYSSQLPDQADPYLNEILDAFEFMIEYHEAASETFYSKAATVMESLLTAP